MVALVPDSQVLVVLGSLPGRGKRQGVLPMDALAAPSPRLSGYIPLLWPDRKDTLTKSTETDTGSQPCHQEIEETAG